MKRQLILQAVLEHNTQFISSISWVKGWRTHTRSPASRDNLLYSYQTPGSQPVTLRLPYASMPDRWAFMLQQNCGYYLDNMDIRVYQDASSHPQVVWLSIGENDMFISPYDNSAKPICYTHYHLLDGSENSWSTIEYLHMSYYDTLVLKGSYALSIPRPNRLHSIPDLSDLQLVSVGAGAISRLILWGPDTPRYSIASDSSWIRGIPSYKGVYRPEIV